MLFEKEIGKLGFGLMRLPKKDNVIDIEQVKEMTDRFMEAGFTKEQKGVVEKARTVLSGIPLIPCTTCNYCAKVCPKNIGISGTFTASNIYTQFNNLDAAKHQEGWLVGGHGQKQAVQCIKCGKCEEVCPQHIKIRDELEKAAALFGQQKED